jgi:proline iminopeptidase
MQDPAVQELLWQGLNYKGSPKLQSVQALLECHYSLHGAFLLEAPLLDHMERIRHIPCVAVQGQMDYVCPPGTAFDLHQQWPEMELRLVPEAGHSMYDPRITDQLVKATDRMRHLRPMSRVGRKAGAGKVSAR